MRGGKKKKGVTGQNRRNTSGQRSAEGNVCSFTTNGSVIVAKDVQRPRAQAWHFPVLRGLRQANNRTRRRCTEAMSRRRPPTTLPETR